MRPFEFCLFVCSIFDGLEGFVEGGRDVLDKSSSYKFDPERYF